MGIADSSSDSENPIDKYILEPASQRMAEDGKDETDGADSGAGEVSRKRKKKAKRSSKSPRSSPKAAPGPQEGVPQPQPQPQQQQEPQAGTSSQHEQQQPQQEGKMPHKAPLAVVGAKVIGDEEEAGQSLEMLKLLRGPRYFDVVYEPKGVSCWRCGKRGHVSINCPLEKAKPCVLCAQYGHESGDCPLRLCYKCGQPGHTTRDCDYPRSSVSWEVQPLCLRCGQESCPSSNNCDYVRAEGGCVMDFHSSDLAQTRCFVCGQRGHLCCQPSPLTLPEPSCWNCGEVGHWGEDCRQQLPTHLQAERAGDRRAHAGGHQRRGRRPSAAELPPLPSQQQQLPWQRDSEQQQWQHQEQQGQQRWQQHGGQGFERRGLSHQRQDSRGYQAGDVQGYEQQYRNPQQYNGYQQQQYDSYGNQQWQQQGQPTWPQGDSGSGRRSGYEEGRSHQNGRGSKRPRW